MLLLLLSLVGYLNKEGSWIKSWKKRYFVLRGDIKELCYYASKEDMTLIGSIKIDKNTYVWTNKTDDDEYFVVSWTPPKNSTQEKREVRLRAADLHTKTIWMEKIASESNRTEALILKDWWNDLFGNVKYQRKGDEIESRKKVDSVLKGLKKFSLTPNPSGIGADNVSPSSSGINTPDLGDDLDAKAEHLALKVLTKLRDRRSKAVAQAGTLTSMGGLFASMDEVIDDGVCMLILYYSLCKDVNILNRWNPTLQ